MQGERRLTQQSQGASTHEPEAERREARAQRILDAASTLILRYGYHKTTIDDIAREAGVGKGTLYLHLRYSLYFTAHLFFPLAPRRREAKKCRGGCGVERSGGLYGRPRSLVPSVSESNTYSNLTGGPHCPCNRPGRRI